MPTKIFLAAVEQNTRHELFNQYGVRYRLLSYYYLRSKKKARLDELMHQTVPTDAVIMIDSGAFTFMDSKKKKFLADPKSFWVEIRKYLDDYKKFLEEYRSRIFCAVELDLDVLLEEESIANASPEWKKSLIEWRESDGDSLELSAPPPVLAWREELKASGCPIVTCWHQVRGMAAWHISCENERYVGLGSSEAGSEKSWFPFLQAARKNEAYAHAFGMTKPEWIRRFSFYTCDSSSWVMGERFGETMFFQHGRVKRYQKAHKETIRHRYRNHFKTWGIDVAKLEADDSETVNTVNLVAWLQFAEYVYKSPSKQDYWKEELNGMPVGTYGPPRGQSDIGEELKLSDEDKEAIDRAQHQIDAESRTEGLVQIATGDLRKMSQGMTLETAASSLMKCDHCFIADRCEYKQEGADCHFKLENKFEDQTDFEQALGQLTRIQYSRTMMGAMVEKMDGGILNPALSHEIDRTKELFATLAEMKNGRATEDSLKIEAKGEGKSFVETLLESALNPAVGRRKKQVIEASAESL